MAKRSGHAVSAGQDARSKRPATGVGSPDPRRTRIDQPPATKPVEPAAVSPQLGADHVEFATRVVVDVREAAGTAIPVTAVGEVALHLVDHRVDPVGESIPLVSLNETVGLLPPPCGRGLEGRETIGDDIAHGELFLPAGARSFVPVSSLSRSLNTFRTFATFGAATA